MAKRMLIDAAHPEETRVVVLNGHRLDEFDFETSTKKQIKGNIYLAKVTRVEPSLQAAFVEYGGNRHGFLAFGEIHPDYYRIPVADRRAAIEAERVAEAVEDEIEERHVEAGTDMPEGHAPGENQPDYLAENSVADFIRGPRSGDTEPRDASTEQADEFTASDSVFDSEPPESREASAFVPSPPEGDAFAEDDAVQSEQPDHDEHHDDDHHDEHHDEHNGEAEPYATVSPSGAGAAEESEQPAMSAPSAPIETVGGDEIDETSRRRARPFRHYKIQEVIKRRQIMLVQVTKEERGNKGAALTTYISLAGRYCVLMPNTPRGGGVSRKITSMTDRRRLKELMDDLQVPEGMGVIVRTAGSERSKVEIKRDFEYLLRLWDEIRELTLKSTAPALIYEEGNLIKRSIRDLYARDIEEVLVDGKDGYETAKSFMRMLMPSHTRRVKFYNDPSVPLFHRFQVEGQLDAIHSPVVQLRSGGYIVINPTEALVAIDVNSGRSTRERNIEETAFKTNLEAAEEIARQLRLRDLAGLIVIDYIDMEEHRNNGAVERRLKESMRYDRARIQLGRISPFGLLELSRQRLRPSLLETSTQPCPHCAGTGHIRSTESTALHVLRAIEEEGMRRRSAEITVAVPSSVALYILNQKRGALQQNEARYGFHVTVTEDDTLVPPAFRLDRARAFTPAEIAALPVLQPLPMPVEEPGDEAFVEEEALDEAQDSGEAPVFERAHGEPEPWTARLADDEQPDEEQGEALADAPGFGGENHGPGGNGHGRRRRRRRRRGSNGERVGGERGREVGGVQNVATQGEQESEEGIGEEAFAGPTAEEMPEGVAAAEGTHLDPQAPGETQSEGERKRRRRGRRGGKRRRRGPGMEGTHEEAEHVQAQDQAPDHLHEQFSYHLDGQETGVAVAQPFTAPADIAAPEMPQARAEHAPPAEVRAAPAPRSQEEAPAPAAEEAERTPVAYNIPPPHEISGPPPNPRRGWWRRR